jgi:hypothetical protein
VLPACKRLQLGAQAAYIILLEGVRVMKFLALLDGHLSILIVLFFAKKKLARAVSTQTSKI